MTVGKIVHLAAAALLFVGANAAEAASSASIDRAFSAEVARILNSVKGEQEFLQELSAAEFREFVSCAQNVMASAPVARKQYVLAAGNQSEMRARFDEVALDNRAALKQQITRDCA
jgi:hypothetical protein